TTSSQSLAGNTAVPEEALHHWLHDLASTLPAPPPHRAAMLRRWLLLAVAIAHHSRGLPGHAVGQQALHQVFPLSTLDANDPDTPPTLLMPAHSWQHTDDMEQALSAAQDPAVRLPALQRIQPPPPSSPEVLYEGEVSIASALPFLLLGPLTRFGYMQTL